MTAPVSLGRTAQTVLPPLATRGVAAITAVSTVSLLAVLGRYGYFGDELYFLSAGRRLSPGYADQGPLLPLLAHVMETMAPGSLEWLRIPAVLATAGAIVISAQIAREFGGSTSAQLLTAGGYATSPFLLVQGSQLATNAIDAPLWVLISWLLIRWVRTRHDALLIWASVATAVAMQVKWLIPFFWICVGIAVLAVGPRELLRRKALWVGAVITVVATLPTVVWQVRHGWPQLKLGGVIAVENEVVGGRAAFLPLAMVLAGALGAVLLVCGTWALTRAESLRPYRFLGLTVMLLFAVFIALGGRAYYAAGIYPLTIAAGAVWLTDRGFRRWQRVLAVPLIAVSVAFAAISLPWQPESRVAPISDTSGQSALDLLGYGRFGWPALAAATVQAYRTLSPVERTHAVVIADSYWQASAVDIFGGDGLPDVYSPSRGWGFFGAPPDTATTVVYVGAAEKDVQKLCSTVQAIGRSDPALGIPGLSKDVTIWKCTGPFTPWSRAWPTMMRLD